MIGMTIVIVFKNGYELKTKCKDLEVTRNNLSGRITNLSYKDVTENKPIDVNFDEVLCMYRVISDEEKAGDIDG